MRRVIVLGTFLLVGLLTVVPAGAQTTQPFDAHFAGTQQKNAAPCPGGAVFCGTGAVAGYGPATYEAIVTGTTPIPGSDCFSVTADITIALVDESGSLTATTTATVCFPGNSQNAPGSLTSFGNPLKASGSFVITGGRGVFAGASGGGDATLRAAGAHSALDLAGTITL